MKRLYPIVFAEFLCAVLIMVGCDKSPTTPEEGSHSKENAAGRSKFIGTWVTRFDTSDASPERKQEKLMYWCAGGTCAESDTFLFIDDTLYSDYEIGFEATYTYNEDSLFFYVPIVGTSEKSLSSAYAYYLSNDTLILDPDSLSYRPVSVRISESPLPRREF